MNYSLPLVLPILCSPLVSAQETRLLAADTAAYDELGYTVALGDGLALVGAPYDSDLGPFSYTGSAYFFDANPVSPTYGQQLLKLTSSTQGTGDRFGRSVALGNGLALLAACLLEQGHQAEVWDLGTVSTLREMVDAEGRQLLRGLLKRLQQGALDEDLVAGLRAMDRRVERGLGGIYRRLFERLERRVAGGGVDFVGLKLWMGAGYRVALELCDDLRARHPGVHHVPLRHPTAARWSLWAPTDAPGPGRRDGRLVRALPAERQALLELRSSPAV